MAKQSPARLKARDPFFAKALVLSLAALALWWAWLEGLPWLLRAGLLPGGLAFALEEAGFGHRMVGQELVLAFGCLVLGTFVLVSAWMYFAPNFLRPRRRRRRGWSFLDLLAWPDEAGEGAD